MPLRIDTSLQAVGVRNYRTTLRCISERETEKD